MKRALPAMLGWLVILVGIGIVAMSHFFVHADMGVRFGMMIVGTLVLGAGIFVVYRAS